MVILRFSVYFLAWQLRPTDESEKHHDFWGLYCFYIVGLEKINYNGIQTIGV